MKNDFILTKELEQERVTKSGIILMEEKWNRKAIVIKSNSEELKEGDNIIKTIGNGTNITIDGKEYEIVHLKYILAKI